MSSGPTSVAMRFVCIAVLAYCLAGFAVFRTALGADKYPDRPLHWIVGFLPGGPTDTVARIVGQPLSDRLGQQVVIENRSGSGGMIAANAVINSPPDGYTVMFVGPNNAIGTTLYKNLPFVFLRDTAPIAGMMRKRHGRASLPAGADGRRVYRIRQAQSRQNKLRLRRQRHIDAHVGGAV